jgi:Spy/CpxP family protein refolding chaperone
MKKIFAIATLVLIGANGFSQANKEMNAAPLNATTPATKSEDHKDKYKDLNLTDDQKIKVKELSKKNKAEKAKIEADATLAADQKAAKLKELKKENSKAFKAILTPQQLATYKATHGKSKDSE